MLEGVEALERDPVAHADGNCLHADGCDCRLGARRVVLAEQGVRVKRDHLLDILPWPLEPLAVYALATGGLRQYFRFFGPRRPSLPLPGPAGAEGAKFETPKAAFGRPGVSIDFDRCM